jgi:hypothetical protein
VHEYRQIGTPVGLERAVILQSLSDGAIDEALASGGPRQATLRDALRTPLILNMVVLAYSDLRGEQIPQVTDLPSWRRALFGQYVSRALRHQPGMEAQPIDYDEETFQRTLTWLGYEVRTHHEGTFYLEHLQWDWLPDAAARHSYRRLTLSLVSLRDWSTPIMPVTRLSWLWASMRRALRTRLLYGLFFWLIGGLLSGPFDGLALLLFFTPAVGPSSGLLAGMRLGGEAALKHLALRIALRRSGVVPRHLVRFLNEATTLVMLRRVGGGYQFIHQYLRDYFADQYVPNQAPATTDVHSTNHL